MQNTLQFSSSGCDISKHPRSSLSGYMKLTIDTQNFAVLALTQLNKPVSKHV